jgi:hypothetical protein
MAHHRHDFKDFADYIAAADDATLRRWPTDFLTTSDFVVRNSKTATFDEAIRLARYGWPEGRERLVAGMATAATMLPAIAPARYLDVGGAYPIVPLACAGDPMNMINLGDTNAAARPIVRIIANCGRLMNVPTSYIENWGIALLSHIDRLEQTGFSVELTLANKSESSRASSTTYSCRVIAKRAGEPLELDRLAFMLAHPAYLRRLNFVLRTHFDDLRYSFGDGMGHTTSIPRSEIERGQIYIAHAEEENDALADLRSALDWIERQIERQHDLDEAA